jgi:hypothetical protein
MDASIGSRSVIKCTIALARGLARFDWLSIAVARMGGWPYRACRLASKAAHMTDDENEEFVYDSVMNRCQQLGCTCPSIEVSYEESDCGHVIAIAVRHEEGCPAMKRIGAPLN